jgi:hypothetical protein
VAKASKAGVFVCSAKWLMVLPKNANGNAT